jgi:hypothetical protein
MENLIILKKGTRCSNFSTLTPDISLQGLEPELAGSISMGSLE